MEVNYSAFQAFRPHFDALARLGYFKLVPKSTSNLKNRLHIAYQTIVWIIIIFYNLQHVLRVVQCRHSADDIVNTLFILLTTLNTLALQLTFNLRSRRIDNLINVIDGSLFAPQKPYHVEVMKANAVVMLQLFRLYMTAVTLCATFFTIFPLVNRAQGVKVNFTGYFPFDTEPSPVFELVVVYLNMFIFLQAYGHVSMDCTIVAFYAQVKVQFQILRYNLENLFNDNEVEKVVKNDVIYKDDSEDFRLILKSRFVGCVTRHLQIKWFIKEVEEIFTACLLFQLIVYAWVICMTVYKLVSLNLLSAEFLSMIIYLGCMLAQLFQYCYYGTQVKYESELVNQSIYCGEWLSVSPQFRRHLLLMMENCKQPITPRTAAIIPISLDTYIAVLRASYTLFTFLSRK